MRSIRDLSLRVKLFGAFAVVVIVFAIGVVVAITSLSSVDSTWHQGATRIKLAETVSADAYNMQGSQLINTLTGGKEIANHNGDVQLFATDLAKLGKVLSSSSDRALFSSLSSQFTAWQVADAQTVKLAAAHQLSAGTTLETGAANTATDHLSVAASTLAKAVNQEAAANASSTKSSSTTIVLLLGLIAVLVSFAVAFVLTRSLKRAVDLVLDRLGSLRDHDIDYVREGLEAFAAGDLTNTYEPVTEPIKDPAGDEIGQVADAVNTVRERAITALAAYNSTADRLSSTIGEVALTAGSVGDSSTMVAATSQEAGRATGEIAHAVSDVAGGAERQVAMIEQVRFAAEEVARAVRESAENASVTAEVATGARAAALDGVQAAEEASSAMQSVRQSSSAADDAIQALAAKSGQIGAIVQTITGIAEQTNLLALNAAIEAARAGEQGKGFAVVAEEVRKLAEESQHAAHEISTLIAAIQGETTKAVSIVQDGAQRTHESTAIVERTREAFERIGAAVDDMTARVEQIAAVSEEISASTVSMQEHIGEVAAVAEQSSASTEEVSASTEETSASTQEIAASAQTLSDNAQALNRLVSGFKLHN